MKLKHLLNIGNRIVYLLAGINIIFVCIMFVAGYSDHLNPNSFPLLSVAGLTLPIFIFSVVAFMLFWLLIKPKYTIISIVGLLLCYSPIRSYFPINIKHETTEKTIKVLSYNVMMFALCDNYYDKNNEILQYMLQSDADIICLQEAQTEPDIYDMLKREMSKKNYYTDSVKKSKSFNTLILFSKYPILGHEKILYESKSNQSVAYYLNIDGDSVMVINNHFESNRISKKEKNDIRQIIRGGMSKDSIKADAKLLISKLIEANKTRSRQVDSVAKFIDNSKIKSIIVCGDFNDNPNSYTHWQLNRRLTDCYRESASGLGFSYKHGGINVRIDNIMCTKNFRPYECKVDSKIPFSDHFPILCKLKKQSKP